MNLQELLIAKKEKGYKVLRILVSPAAYEVLKEATQPRETHPTSAADSLYGIPVIIDPFITGIWIQFVRKT